MKWFNGSLQSSERLVVYQRTNYLNFEKVGSKVNSGHLEWLDRFPTWYPDYLITHRLYLGFGGNSCTESRCFGSGSPTASFGLGDIFPGARSP